MDQKRLERQNQAVDKAIQNPNYSIFEFVTGVGKTYTSLLFYWRVKDQVNNLDIVVPTNYLKDKWEKELEYYNITGNCYTIVSYIKKNRNPDLLIVDEIHNCAGETAKQFPKVLNNKPKYGLGLSATLEKEQKDFLKSKGWSVADKIELGEARVNNYIPDYFVYNLELEFTGKERYKYDLYDQRYNKYAKHFGHDFALVKKCLNSLYHCCKQSLSFNYRPDTVRDYYKTYQLWYSAKNPNNVKKYTEKLESLKTELNRDDHPYSPSQIKGYAVQVMNSIQNRKKVIWNAEAKLDAAKKLIETLNYKTILFSQANQFANNLEEKLNGKGIAFHSGFSQKQRNKRYDEFINNPEKLALLTSQTMNEGADLPDLQLGIIASYTSTSRSTIQRTGRLLRGSDSIIVQFVIKDSQEEKWLRKSQKKHDQNKIKTVQSVKEIENDTKKI